METNGNECNEWLGKRPGISVEVGYAIPLLTFIVGISLREMRDESSRGARGA